MNIKITGDYINRRAGAAMVEALCAIVIVAGVAGSVLGGITTGLYHMQMARENLRASQIMLEKVETIRLYTWDQINSNGFIPREFSVWYDPNSTGSKGVKFNGQLSITPATIAATYTNDIKLISVKLSWNTGKTPRTREFSTYFSRYGVQDYIY
jgi:hypothetical protein